MPRDKLCRLEIDIFNATRKFANKCNREKKKQMYFAKMEDQAGNGTNSVIFKLDCLGNANVNGFARATYIYNSYNEGDWKVNIDGAKIKDRIAEKYVFHKIVGEYKEFLIKEIPEIEKRIG
jgi:hypothetical protein